MPLILGCLLYLVHFSCILECHQSLSMVPVLKYIISLSSLKICIVNDNKPITYFSTPFLGPGSLQLKSRNSRFITQCYPGYKLRIVFSTPKCISHFFPFKDSIPTLLRSSVVYCYKCLSCNV